MTQPDVRVARTGDILSVASSAQVEDLLADLHWQGRHSRLRRQQDRDDFLAARLLALDLVTQTLGRSGRLVQSCPTCGLSGHGRPVVEGNPDIAVSWAHSDGIVGAAVGRAESIGFDLEKAHPNAPIATELAIAGRAFVRGEALVKAGLVRLDEALALNPSWSWRPAESYSTSVNGRRVTVQDVETPDRPDVIASVAWT